MAASSPPCSSPQLQHAVALVTGVVGNKGLLQFLAQVPHDRLQANDLFPGHVLQFYIVADQVLLGLG